MSALLAVAVEADAAAGVDAMRRAAGAPVEIRMSRDAGTPAFVRTERNAPIPLGLAATAAADQRARAFLHLFGRGIGLPDADDVAVLAVSAKDEAGMEHVRLAQVHDGVPVSFSQITVHLRDTGVVAVHARTVADVAGVDTIPTITAEEALAAASTVVRGEYGLAAQLSPPQLEIFNRGLLEQRNGTSRLAWRTEATASLLRVSVWVDAHTGEVLFHLNQLAEAMNRQVYDLDNNPSTPLPGALVRSEGDPPTGVTYTDNVYDFSQDTYDYYLTEHGRDSYDDAGGTMVATVRYCDLSCGCPCLRAFHNGVQTLFGEQITFDDIVGHEWTHGVTQYSAGLIYYKASGALNESYSDIFGETIDLGNGAGTDGPGDRWHISEWPGVLPLGIRNMMDPTLGPVNFGPGKMSDDTYFVCGPADNGGVHSNSGIGNHAFALMVDGGSYNGFTVTGIGLTKAAKIEYRALTQYLVPSSGFPDNYDALNQSCTDLIGVIGITAADCTEVTKALDAIEMSDPWPCDCGNGTLDVDEECDDGNQDDGDCCSSTCHFEAPAAPCTDGNPCTDDQCDGAGACVSIDNSDPCDDGSACTAGDTCSAGVCAGTAQLATGCRVPTLSNRALLLLKSPAGGANPAKRRLALFKWLKGEATSKADFGDPLSSTSYHLCVFDDTGAGTQVVTDLTAPPGGTCKNGKPCWRETAKGFKYVDRDRSQAGLLLLLLKEGDDGKAKIIVKAKGENLAAPPLPLDQAPRVTAQIIRDGGACWQAELSAPAKRATSEIFKDKGD